MPCVTSPRLFVLALLCGLAFAVPAGASFAPPESLAYDLLDPNAGVFRVTEVFFPPATGAADKSGKDYRYTLSQGSEAPAKIISVTNESGEQRVPYTEEPGGVSAWNAFGNLGSEVALKELGES
ncbi:hypothetical protein BH09SUM1_BH09SUM1_19930 [soil metagenome]